MIEEELEQIKEHIIKMARLNLVKDMYKVTTQQVKREKLQQ